MDACQDADDGIIGTNPPFIAANNTRGCAVLANFKAGTIVKQANSQQLVLAYGGKKLTSIDDLASFFSMQSLPTALLELTQSDYNSSWRCWVAFCITMGVPARAALNGICSSTSSVPIRLSHYWKNRVCDY